MNYLCWNIEQWEKSLYKIKPENTFGLLYNEYIPFDEKKFNKVYDLYEKFIKEQSYLKEQERIIRNRQHPYYDNLAGDLSIWEISYTKVDFSKFYNVFKKKALEICPNKQELANYAVKIVYEIHPNRDKSFAWIIAEEGLLKNLKPSNKIFNIKETHEREGCEYLGRWYKIEEI
jgi:hypothetical protein